MARVVEQRGRHGVKDAGVPMDDVFVEVYLDLEISGQLSGCTRGRHDDNVDLGLQAVPHCIACSTVFTMKSLLGLQDVGWA